MTLAGFADLAEVIGALGVIAGLIFVGVQLRQNTRQMQRDEMNSAMAQGSALKPVEPPPSATAPQDAETAVAPPADAG